MKMSEYLNWLINPITAILIMLPLFAFWWFGESFESSALVYLAMIAYFVVVGDE